MVANEVLPGDIRDRASFFAAMQHTLPLDPPLDSDRSWDALADSVSGGLYLLTHEKVAIIWPKSAEMASADSDSFKTATAILADAAQLLAESGVVSKKVAVIIG